MGVLRRIAEQRASLENPATPLSNPAAWLIDIFGGERSYTGKSVNERNALTSVSVFAATRVIAESVASLPLPVYKRLDPRGKERATSHPLYALLHDRPNPNMSSFTFREALQAHLCLWGNAFAEIETNGAGRPIALWPITPDRVKVTREGTTKYYIVTVDNRQIRFESNQILHIPGLSFDGLVGYSPVQLARQAIGLALATEEFGARFFGNGANPGGVLTHPNTLSEEAQKRLKKSWEEKASGLSNAHRIQILEEGMKWEKIGVPPEDAQFLETRKFQVSEIARWFRVPPHMIGDLDRATFSNIEQQSIDFVTHSLRPWLVRWEQVLNWDLFGERSPYYAEFVVDGLLRGDTQARYAAYNIGRNAGFLSANDIREMENMNPLPGKQGDLYLVPLNTQPADQVGKQPQPVVPVAPKDPAAQKVRAAFARVIEDAVQRVARREGSAAKRAAKKGKDAFVAWVNEFYANDNTDYAERQFLPVFESLAAALGESVETARSYAKIAAAQYSARSRTVLLHHFANDAEPNVDSIVDEWVEGRAREFAQEQAGVTFGAE